MHHSIAIGLFELELESGIAQFGSKLAIFLSCVILKIDVWPWKAIGHIFYTMSNSLHHFKSIGEVKLELQSGNAQFASKLAFFVLRDLEIWWMTLKNNRAPLLYYIKLRAAFQSHWYIHAGVTVRKRSIQVKIGDFFFSMTLKIDMTLRNNRAPLLCCFKLCASFHSHWWIQTGVTVRNAQLRSKSIIFLAVRL